MFINKTISCLPKKLTEISSIFDGSLGATSTNPQPQSSNAKRQDTGASSSLVNKASNPNLQVISQNASDDDLISIPENVLSTDSSKSSLYSYSRNPMQNTMSTGNYSPFKPVFNNCNNCNITLNFNFKN